MPRGTVCCTHTHARVCMDRAYGRPPQFTTGNPEQFRRACDLNDDELAAIIAGARPAPPVTAEREAKQSPPEPKKMN